MEAAELVVRITGDIADIEAKLNRTASAAQSMGSRIESAGRQMSSAGRALSVGFTAPVVALGGFALKSATDFESAFAGVRKTVDATEAEFGRLETGIRQMSKVVPAAATEIAGVAEAAGQLGIKKEAILGFTRTMVDLGVSTNLTANDAAVALARLANITQMPQDQFDRLGSTVVALGNNLATTEAEIVEFGLRLAGAGNQIGLNEAQILSFAGALSSLGINAEAGGTAFSRLFINIAKAVDEGGAAVEQFAAVAGMSGAQFSKAFKDDAAGALVSFVEGLGRVKDEGGSLFAVLDDLGLNEIRLRDALLRSAGAGDLLRKSLNLGTAAWQENTALTDEAARRYETAASQIAMFKNKVTDAAVTMGGQMVPSLLRLLGAMEPVGRFLMGAVEWFSRLPGPVQTVALGLVALVAAAGPVLIFLGAITTAVGTLAPAVAAAAGFILGPIGLVVLAIAAVGVGLYALWRNWGTVWGWISDAAGAAKDFIVRSLALIVAPFAPFVGLLIWLGQNWDSVWSDVRNVIGRAASWVMGRIDALVGTLASLPGRAWGAAASFIDRMWDLAYSAMARMGSAVTDGLSRVVGWLGELPGRAVDAVGHLGGMMWDLGRDAMVGLLNGLKSMAGAVLGWAADFGKKVLGAIGKVIGWGSPATEFIAMGEDSLLGLMLGYEAYKDRLLETLRGIGAASVDAAAVSFGRADSGPSSFLSEVGPRAPGSPGVLVLEIDGRELARLLLPDITDGLHRVDVVNAR